MRFYCHCEVSFIIIGNSRLVYNDRMAASLTECSMLKIQGKLELTDLPSIFRLVNMPCMRTAYQDVGRVVESVCETVMQREACVFTATVRFHS